MFDLAMHEGQGPVPLRDVAKRQNISEKYLGHLIPPLKNAGLIHSTRGANGGYVLAKPPAQITLKDILSTLEGPLCLVACVEKPSLCKRAGNCVSREIWHEATEKMLLALSSITLKGMIEKDKRASEALSYAI
jgi:Rrf2 family protein